MARREKVRNETATEVLIEPGRLCFASLDELIAACLPALTARIWEACCWPEELGEWDLGDYNYLVVTIARDRRTSLYIQYWSEPHEPVSAEVCSGKWNPRALEFIRAGERRKIEEFGYWLDPFSPNFRKDISIDSAEDAENAAREALELLHSVFGYRGQWPLAVELGRGQRSAIGNTDQSLTPHDFCKAAAISGFEVERLESDGDPLISLRRGRRKSMARLEGKVKGQNLYSAVRLTWALRAPGVLNESELARLNALVPMGKVAQDEGTPKLQAQFILLGGVTTEWILGMLQAWKSLCAWTEKALRSVLTTRAAGDKATGPRRIH